MKLAFNIKSVTSSMADKNNPHWVNAYLKNTLTHAQTPTKIFSTFILLISLLITPSLYAHNVVVVVNASNSEVISSEMIKQIYTDKRNFWASGKEILLFELPVKDTHREMFSNTLLKQSAISSQSDWANRYVQNTIKNTVKIKPHKLVAKFVSLHKYAIGYLPESVAKQQKNLKIVMTIDNQHEVN